MNYSQGTRSNVQTDISTSERTVTNRNTNYYRFRIHYTTGYYLWTRRIQAVVYFRLAACLLAREIEPHHRIYSYCSVLIPATGPPSQEQSLDYASDKQ